MIEGINYIGFSTSKNGSGTLQAYDPEANRQLPEQFSTATEEDIDQAMEKAHQAFLEYRNFSGEKKAVFLDQISEEIIALGDELVERASTESGLPTGRIEGERGRTTGQLQLFADLLRKGDWVDARIDRGEPDVRRMLFHIGPVAVFGASNFPLAFSTAGGDTASALAAGCPVIVKAHESIPAPMNLWLALLSKPPKKLAYPTAYSVV